uniref:3-keto-disaccharide hydrolase domain-containing protein n=1 Tax=Candidatus Methanophaga sp. ANME-1 ERB7 TaxID=2759913 RepID=A0A7G9Z2U2_9EURY|nr:hypothetical protein KENJCFKB_00037 [Methanosarcinales archaeon ANME-1 ERB7]
MNVFRKNPDENENEIRGNEFDIYANGILLNTVEDTSLSCGMVGLFAADASFSTGPDTVQFDNIKITRSGESKPTPTPGTWTAMNSGTV